MVRKRSLSAVLDDDSRPIATPSSRIRSIPRVLSENPTPTHSRSDLVACNCSKCNGKFVEPRTARIHQIIHQTDQNSDVLDGLVDITLPTIYLSNEPSQLPQQIPIECDYDERGEASTSRSIPQPDEIHSQIEEQEEESQQDDHLAFLPRNRLRRHTNRCVSSSSNNFEQDSAVESTEEDTSTSDF
jgi:hypothetical protein